MFLKLGLLVAFCLTFFAQQNLNKSKDSFWLQSKLGAQALAQGDFEKRSITPDALYSRAWNLIKENYYDQNFGNQDWSRWQSRYSGKLKTTEDADKAIESMLASLNDPYTRFLSKDAFDEEKSQIEAHLFGVGMQLGMNKEHKVVVIAPIQDTPADRAGIHAGDEIIEVDRKPVKGQSLDQVVKQIRGLKGTKVLITILRNTKKEQVELTRAEIPIKAVANVEVLPGNIGYIRLESFISHRANEEMKEALKKVGSVRGLVLDLRLNPGGLLSNAIEIANMFMDKGIIVSTIDKDGYKTSQLAVRGAHNTIPMVVLINKGSASASEILSGALRDNGRAKLVGEKSFGKGLVQAIHRLDDGSGMNVTIAKYLTPNDTDIHKTGIIPDYEIAIKEDDYKTGKGPWWTGWMDTSAPNYKRSPQDGKDVQLAKALEVLNKQLAEHVNTNNSANVFASSSPTIPKN
jgi:carboxyl-terminal processing protease